MKILSKYLMSTILRFTIMVLLIVAAVDAFIYLIGEFGDVGQGNYGIGHAFLYVLLILPGQIYQLFPMIGLLGALIALGLLAQNSELVVMRAAGMQLGQMMRIVIQLAVAMIITVTLIGEFVAPQLTQYAENMKLFNTSSGQAVQTRHGLWLRDNNRYIYVGAVMPDMTLRDVSVYQFGPNRELETAMHASKAVKVGVDAWQLNNVTESILDHHKVLSKTLASTNLTVKLNTRTAQKGSDFTSQLSLMDLYSDIQQQESVGMSASTFKLAFWQRLVQPFAALVMIMLAIPFIFGPLRSVTMGLRIVTGAAVGFAFYLLNQFFGPFCLVYQIPVFLGAILPTLFFAGLGFWLLKRVR